MTHLLLVEDDTLIRDALARALRSREHEVSEASAGLQGLQMLIDRCPDIVILDLGLPDIDGPDLLRMLRSVSAVPVIVATARDDEAEIVRVLDAGADDYVIKPFSAEQIDARCRAVLRRQGVADLETPRRSAVAVGGLCIDPVARVATLDGESLTLSRKEFDALLYLAEREGEVVTKQELLIAVWKQAYLGSEKTVDTHLSWLRAKLGETATSARYLRTVRGVGIKLVAPGD